MTSMAGGSSNNAELTNTLLAAAVRADPAAEAQLHQWKSTNYADFALALAVEISAQQPPRPPEVRQMAALVLKNMLYAKNPAMLQENQRRWKEGMTVEQRALIKSALLTALASSEVQAAHSAAIAASEIAAVELPYQQWDELVPTLMERVVGAGGAASSSSSNSATAEIVQLASLECLGYTAERIAELEELLADSPTPPPELASTTVDKMLTTIVHGVQPTRNNTLRLAAITALRNSLAFVRKNMSVPSERDFIFNAICEATRCTDARVRQLAFACMDTIAENYYEKLQDYMTVLFQLTTEAIKTDHDDAVKMAAIEFWNTVALVEQGLLDEEREYQEELMRTGVAASEPPRPCPKYTQSAMEGLVPLLLESLTKQEEDVEDDEWNIQAAGAVCLETLSATVESLIVPSVMPFVEQNITHENWRLRDAAIVAFASILDGPATQVMAQFISQAIPVLLAAFSDGHVVVRDSATHCISKICRLHLMAVPQDQMNNIFHGLIAKLSEPSPRVASHACSAIFNIANSLKATYSGGVPETNALSSPMMALLQALLQASDREDAVDSHLRVAALSAAAELVAASGRDVLPIFREFLPVLVQRMEVALKMQVVSNEDNENKEQLLGLLCALVTSLFQRLDQSHVAALVDRIMELLLQILNARNSSCLEEAFLSVGAIANAIEGDFQKYLPAFIPILLQGIRSFQYQNLCQVAVGVVVDLCTAVGSHIQPFCDEIMRALREALEDGSVSRDIKPLVIACFGDVAMAITSAYEPYLQVSVMMLMQASQQSAPPDDEDLVAFINSLRLSILEAYSGIIMGLSDGNALHLFLPNVPAVLQFLQFLSSGDSNKDDIVLQKAVCLIGDIALQMGNHAQVMQQINQPFAVALIQEAGRSDDPEIREVATWAQGVVQRAVMGTA